MVLFGTGLWDKLAGIVDPTQDPEGAYGVGSAFGTGIQIAVGWVIEQGAKIWGGLKEVMKGFWNGLTGENAVEGATGAGEKIGAKIGTVVKEGLKAAAVAVENFVTENPRVAAMLALATGTPLGVAAAGGILAAAFINTATGKVSDAQKATADAAIEAAKKASKYDETGTTMADALRQIFDAYRGQVAEARGLVD